PLANGIISSTPLYLSYCSSHPLGPYFRQKLPKSGRVPTLGLLTPLITSASHAPLEVYPPWFSTITLIPSFSAYSARRDNPSTAYPLTSSAVPSPYAFTLMVVQPRNLAAFTHL